MNQTDADHILAVLREFLVDRFDIPSERATPATALADLGLDSMMVMDIMLDVEDRLGVKLEDLALPRNASLGDVVDLVRRNAVGGAAS